MGSFSIWHWLIVLAVVVVLFGGGGKLSRLMGDFGKGLRSFRKNVGESDSSAEADSIEPDNAEITHEESVNLDSGVKKRGRPKGSKSKAKSKKR